MKINFKLRECVDRNFLYKVSSCTVLIVISLITQNTANAIDHSLSLVSSGAQTINMLESDETMIGADSINVATTCRFGYNLTINTSVNDNNLYLNGDPSNDEIGKYFTPSDGYTTLADSTNTWGYYTGDTAPTNSSVFNPVPVLGNTDTIKTPLATPSSTDIDDSFSIYYGVSLARGMPAGTYKMIPDTNNDNKDGAIVYQATIADDCLKYKIEFNPTSTSTGETITGTGTMNPQSIYNGTTTNLNSNEFTAPNGYYFLGWNTSQDGTGEFYMDNQSVTDLTMGGDTITLYAQWTDCPGKSICYTANAASASEVTGSMANQPLKNNSDEATLYAANFKRSNYGFAGWNTKKDGTGIDYGPNQTIRFTAGKYQNGGLRLYAKWLASAGNLQNWTCPNNTDMPIGEITALKDTRDNNVYAVAKLADGKCWIVENLRLNNTPTLSTTNTHNPSLPLTNSDGTSTSNKLSTPIDPTVTAWCSPSTATCDDKSMLATNNTTKFTSNTSDSQGDIYSYGNYYNWYSATAGQGKYSKASGSVAGDICPAGWRLPTSGSATADFGTLDKAMGGTGISGGSAQSEKWRGYPNNFVKSGHIITSTVDYRNSYGIYWSSTAFDNKSAYVLFLSNNGVELSAENYYKNLGRVVRCVKNSQN